MRESFFASEVKKSCESQNIFYYKIPDSVSQERFTPQKPFDSFLLHRGKFYAVEFKMVQMKAAFSFDRVRPHQIEALQSVAKHGGTGFIIINYRFKGYNKAFAIEINAFLDMKKSIEETGRKSIPLKILEEETIQLTRYKDSVINKYVWDIYSLICPNGV